MLVPPVAGAGALVAGTVTVGVLTIGTGGAEADAARPSLIGVAFSSFRTSLSFPALATRALPIVMGMTEARAEAFLGFLSLLPLELEEAASSLTIFLVAGA